MKLEDYDNSDVEELWCQSQRSTVMDYLGSKGIRHGRIGEWPAWHIAPYVSLWAIESVSRPEWIGWWAICGDLPTDYISAADCNSPQHPRKALRSIAERWLHALKVWKEGLDYEDFQITGNYSQQELAPMLASRAKLLIEWTKDESLWENG